MTRCRLDRFCGTALVRGTRRHLDVLSSGGHVAICETVRVASLGRHVCVSRGRPGENFQVVHTNVGDLSFTSPGSPSLDVSLHVTADGQSVPWGLVDTCMILHCVYPFYLGNFWRCCTSAGKQIRAYNMRLGQAMCTGCVHMSVCSEACVDFAAPMQLPIPRTVWPPPR